MKQPWKSCLCAIAMIVPVASAQATEATDTLQASYAAEAQDAFSAERGAAMWTQQHMQKKLQKSVSCSSCHGTHLRRQGEHIRTGKVIEPMATAVNPERLNDVKKIRKWLRRNCKWTWGRECTAQEKGDFLQYLTTVGK